MSADFWTAENCELCRTLLALGRTGAQIAAELGGGITRNAVIGKINRQHWRGPDVKPRPKKTRVPRKAATTALRCAIAVAAGAESADDRAPTPLAHYAAISFCETGPKRLLDLTADECKWPIGDPRDPGFCFCAERRITGYPYCAGHSRIAYNIK